MRRRSRAREGWEKRENRRSILKKLCNALLRSFRRQHIEKIKGSPGYLGLSGSPTAISTQLKRGRGPHHHVETAVDWCRKSYIAFRAAQKLFRRLQIVLHAMQ